MNKTLRLTLLSLLMLVCGGVFAQEPEVTFDFTSNTWGFSETKATERAAFTDTNTGYTIYLTGTSGNGYRWYSNDKYLINGKKGATLEFPAFNFDVEKIVVEGRSGASGSTKQNIYVGDEAVSTETTGATGTNTYEIAEAYQAAGNLYVLKVTSDHNTQYTKIHIYKKQAADPDPEEGEKVYATFENPTGITWDAENKTFEWTSQWGNQLKNIGLPSGNLLPYDKLVVDCEILEGDGYRLMFYANSKGQTAGGVTIITESGKKEFKLSDFAMDLAYLTDCSEICLSGYNASGKVKVNEVYLVKSDDPTIAFKVALSQYITTAKLCSPIGKTEDSFAALTAAIAAGEAVLANAAATQEELAAAQTAITEAAAALQLAEGYSVLTADLFQSHTAQGQEGTATGCAYDINVSSGLPYGDGNVNWLNYADLSAYDKLIVVAPAGTPRFCMNRTADNAQDNDDPATSQFIDIPGHNWGTETYQTKDGDNVWVIDLKKMVADKGIAYLHSIKGAYGANVTVTEMLLFKDTTAPEENVDFTDHIVNADLASTEGWTANLSGGYREFGNGKIGEYQAYIAPATADATHTADEYCFGFECRWNTNYSSVYQNTAALPAGTYRLTYDVENVNGSTTKANYENRFAVSTANNVFADQQTEWMNGKSSWTTHTIEFTVDIPGAVRVSFGYGTGSNNIGSNNTPALYVSHVKLVQLEEAVATEYSLNQPSADFLVNGNFDTANQGWALSNMGYQANQERPTRYVEKWQPSALTGSGYASQTLVAMPAGAYLLKATVHTNQAENGGTKLTIGNKDQNVSGAWKEYTILYNNETDGADIPVSFSYNNAKSNWVAIDNFSVVYIGEYAKVENFFALQEEIAKAEAMADADAPMVGWLYDAIDEAKAVFDNNAATAEELDAAVEALQLAEADYTQHNTPSAETTINVTDKVGTSQQAWNGSGWYSGAQVTNSLGQTMGLPEFYGSTDAGVKLHQTVTGLENGTYVVKLFATSHNAWYNYGAALEDPANDVAYVFANDQKTWITAYHNGSFEAGEATNYHTIDNVQVTDGTLNMGLALDKSGQTEWQTIQIYELGQYAPAKLAYQTKREALNEAIVEVQAWADNTAMTNGKETLNDAIAAAQAVYESNKVTPAEVDAAAAAVRAAVKAYIEANPAEIANGAYYVKNNNGLFLAAGADWGTHAVVNEIGLDYTFALADGKYTLDSQVSNGGNSKFLNGVWNDGAAMGWGIYKVSETEVIITDGNGYLAPNGNNFVELVSEITDAAKWTIVAAADRQAELLATLDAATATNGVDATFLLKGANFNRNDLRNSAWVVSRNGGNQTIAGPSENRGTYGCESWNNTFEVKQALTDLPQGIYEFQMAGFGTNGTTMIYGDVVFGTTMAPFVNTTSAANFRTALDAIANGEFTGNTSGKFIVTDGNATVGVKRDVNQAADWAVFDNARLVYFGNDLSFYVEAYEKAVAAANAIKDKKMSAAAKSVLDEALATYGDVDRESREAMIEAVPVLNEATAAAKAAIEAYEVAKAALNDIAAVLNKTNVYTPEAYSAFKVDFEAKRRAFKEGELTDEEAIAIREAILPTGYRQDNTIDDLLLSAWSVNGEQCKDYEKALYINTWSTEGDTDGSGFKAPFFEYYSNQENEFTATMNNVEPGIYNVTAWVRVRSGNDEPAAGVTFQANDTEAVDVCDGDELWSGANHFFLKNVETVATVAEDGVLTLTFKVAAGNNCNWLSFKDVMFTMDVQATANAEKAAQMADAQGQVDDAKAELADAIVAAQEVYNTGDVRYPSAVELAEAIVNAQAALDGTADLTKLSQLNKTLVALNNALDEINNAKDAAEANLMGEHVIYFWPAGTEQANEITLAEGVTLAITGNTSKKIQNGSNVTVYGKKYTSMKVSNGAQNTLTTQKYVKSITFYSYINKKHDADGLRDSYWKEVAGVAYDAETSGGLMSLYSDGNLTKPEGRYFEISDKDHPTKTVTFNNAGEQLCYVMDVEYWDETVGVEEVSAARLVKAEDVYNLQGQKVERPVKGGLYIVGGRKVVVK